MNPRSLARLALIGALVVALVATLVLAGAGHVLADPEQRAHGDAVADETTLQGAVVAEDPVTIETADGQRIVQSDASASLSLLTLATNASTAVRRLESLGDPIDPDRIVLGRQSLAKLDGQ